MINYCNSNVNILSNLIWQIYSDSEVLFVCIDLSLISDLTHNECRLHLTWSRGAIDTYCRPRVVTVSHFKIRSLVIGSYYNTIYTAILKG